MTIADAISNMWYVLDVGSAVLGFAVGLFVWWVVLK